MSTNSSPAMERPASVAILTLPEVGASTVFGMYDMFMSTGRDWGLVVNGAPGPQLIAPRHCSLACADAHVTALLTCLGRPAPAAPFPELALAG